MAGSRIKGITVEIGGNTTKLQSDLKGVNSEIKNTQSQLKDVEKLLKLDPGNTELLAQKQNCPLFIIDKIIHNKVVYRKLAFSSNAKAPIQLTYNELA